jgi:sirohydrochlorin ferrochelatase
MPLEVFVDATLGVGFDLPVEVVVVPHLLYEAFFVVRVAVPDESSGREARSSISSVRVRPTRPLPTSAARSAASVAMLRASSANSGVKSR